MGMNPYQVVKDFEQALCDYTGAPYAVTTMSCTAALLLAVAWHLKYRQQEDREGMMSWHGRPPIDIPKRTYVSVPMSIIHAGGRPTFRDEDWKGGYRLKPFPIWDFARRFTSGMYSDRRDHGVVKAGLLPSGKRFEISLNETNNFAGHMLCVSFHWSKILGIQQGGAILLDDPEAAAWLRRARFDGRTEGVAVKDDKFDFVGWHFYMSPEIAAEGLQRIGLIPKHNDDLPNDEYPDLSDMKIFQ